MITVNTLGLPASLEIAEAGGNTCDRTCLRSGPPLWMENRHPGVLAQCKKQFSLFSWIGSRFEDEKLGRNHASLEEKNREGTGAETRCLRIGPVTESVFGRGVRSRQGWDNKTWSGGNAKGEAEDTPLWSARAPRGFSLAPPATYPYTRLSLAAAKLWPGLVTRCAPLSRLPCRLCHRRNLV